MRRSPLHRTIARLSRCLSAAALALTLATAVVPSTKPAPDPLPKDQIRFTPQVNWNS
ncbi:MAG TPA: hypothetical protein VFU22_23145 [Roseiflexaceae bacterium]|nr:hypothetical protein [Roseiflexaceae bacterium]